MQNTTLLPRIDPKISWVRLNHLSDQFRTVCNPHREASIDEAMVAFKGRSSMKQYMSKKPIKRGFKVWVRADAVTGYVSVYTAGEQEFSLGLRA